MLNYGNLASIVANASPSASSGLWQCVLPTLVDAWVDDYAKSARNCRIVETTVERFSYLFDLTLERLLAAWGVSAGANTSPRDKSRMAGHPLSAGAPYHRGHAIPHSLGGPTDINLVPQQGRINVGPFRELEKRAVATPGALYFTYWMYRPGDSQTPHSVQQGLLVPGQAPQLRVFPN